MPFYGWPRSTQAYIATIKQALFFPHQLKTDQKWAEGK